MYLCLERQQTTVNQNKMQLDVVAQEMSDCSLSQQNVENNGICPQAMRDVRGNLETSCQSNE